MQPVPSAGEHKTGTSSGRLAASAKRGKTTGSERGKTWNQHQ